MLLKDPFPPVIGATRFELVTSCSQGRRANQAALRPASRIPGILSVERRPGQGRVPNSHSGKEVNRRRCEALG
jgi:hypothetical protein